MEMGPRSVSTDTICRSLTWMWRLERKWAGHLQAVGETQVQPVHKLSYLLKFYVLQQRPPRPPNCVLVPSLDQLLPHFSTSWPYGNRRAKSKLVSHSLREPLSYIHRTYLASRFYL
jgi:hypothetical protein